jgi:hypothetical protein
MRIPQDFGPREVVTTFRAIIAVWIESATTPKARRKHDRTAAWLRKLWKSWQGEDSLHEMAFGERFEAQDRSA